MSKLKALLLVIRNETTPIAGHTDPMALNDVWSEVFEIIDAAEHHAHSDGACPHANTINPLGRVFCPDCRNLVSAPQVT